MDKEMVYRVIADFRQHNRETRKGTREAEKYQEQLEETNKAEREGADAERELAHARRAQGAQTRRTMATERAYRTDLGKSSQRIKELTATQRKRLALEQELRKAELDLIDAENKYNAAMSDTSAGETQRVSSLTRYIKAIDGVATANKRLSTSERDVERDSDGVSRSVAGATRAMSGAGGAGRGLTNIFGALGGAMGAARAEGKNFGAVLSTLKIPLVVGAVYALIGAISSLTAGVAALIPQLVQASSILAGLPGLIFGAVQAVGVGALAFSGIGDAVKALADRQAAAKEIAQEQADAQANLASTQRAAAEAIESAEENLADSHDAVRRAQEALTEARKDAKEALEDLRWEVEQAAISEERAEISVIEARRRLQELMREGGTDIELREARLDLREAELGVQQARDASKDSQEELREAERKGISGSDQVVAAQEALSDAVEASADAQEALNETMRSSAQSVAEAKAQLSGLSSEQEKLREAFRALTPEARAFARQLLSMRPLLDELRATAQRGVLPGAGDALQRLTVLFPAVERAVGRTGEVLGELFRRLAARLTTPEWLRDLPILFSQSDYVIRAAGEGLADFADIIRDFMVAARPVTLWITDTIGGWLEFTRGAVEAGRESGRLQAFFLDAIDAAEQLGRIVGDTIVAIVNVFRQGAEVGQTFWDQIEDGAQAFRDLTESAEGQNSIRQWFEDARPAIEAAVRLLGAVGSALLNIAGESSGSLAALFDTVRTKLVPAFVTLGESVSQNLLPAFVELVAQIVEFFSVIGGQGGTLSVFFETLALVFNVINELVAIPFVKWLLGVAFAVQGVVSAVTLLGAVMKASFIGSIMKGTGILGGTLIPMLVRFGKLLAGVAAVARLQGVAAGLNSLGAVFGGLVGAINPVTAALTGMAAVAAIIYFRMKDDAEAVRQFTDELVSGTKAQEDFIKSAAKGEEQNFWDQLITGAERLPGALQPVGLALGSLFKTTEERAQEAVRNVAEFNRVTVGMGNAFRIGQVGADEYLASVEAVNEQMPEGSVTTEEWAAIIERDFLPAMRDGALTTDEWNRVVALGNEHGLDAVDMLQQFNEEQDKLALSRGLDAWRADYSSAFRNFEKITGTTFENFRDQAVQAFDTGGMEGLQTFVHDQIDQLEALRDAYRENFDAVGEAYSELSGDAKVSSDEIYKAFKEQLDVVQEYDANWRELEKRGTPERVLDQLRELGLDGAAIVKGLADASEEDFQRTTSQMLQTESASKRLADNVNEELADSIDKLIKVLRKLANFPEIVLGIDLDTSSVRDKMNDLIDKLESQGFTLSEIRKSPALGGGVLGGTVHTGGAIPGGMNASGVSGPPKSDEVDARLLVGEYVFSREAVKAAGGLRELDRVHRALRGGLRPTDPAQVDPHSGEPLRGGFKQRRAPGRRKYFHSGGPVFSGGLSLDPRLLEGGFGLPALYKDIGTNSILGKVFAKLTPSGWEIGFDGGSTKGSGTPGMNALNNWIHKNFNVNGSNFVAGPGRFINFNPANGLSQHAFGNAGDYTGRFSVMDALFRGIVRAAESRSIRTLGHAIFNRQAWSYNSQNIGPYTGSIPHTDHAHIDALPQWAGPWPGHPVPPAQYHGGGLVQREGQVHPGELVFNKQVTDNFIKALTGGGGFMAPLPNISAVSTRSPALLGASDGDEPNAGRGTTMEVALDVDGTRLSRTVELHSRRNKVLLPSRSRR